MVGGIGLQQGPAGPIRPAGAARGLGQQLVGALGGAQVPAAQAEVGVYGPADAPLGLVRGRRRKRFLVRADRTIDLQAFLSAWRARVKVPGSVRVTIDVDPYSFL